MSGTSRQVAPFSSCSLTPGFQSGPLPLGFPPPPTTNSPQYSVSPLPVPPSPAFLSYLISFSLPLPPSCLFAPPFTLL